MTLPTLRGVGAAAPPKLAASKLPKPFTVPFVRPPDAVPVAQDATTDYYVIDEIAAQAEVIPGYRSWVYSYGGSVPGPLIHAQRNRAAVVRFRNKLPATHPTLGYESSTSVHLHGGNSLPQYDGYAGDITRSGEYKDYHYGNIETGRTIWYHDHAFGITRINAYAGVATAYVIRDRFEKERPLAGLRMSGCLHITSETANLALTLKAGGADLVLCCTPPAATAQLYMAWAARPPRGVIVDIASIKTPLVPAIRTLQAAGARVASMPSITGICRSVNTTSISPEW